MPTFDQYMAETGQQSKLDELRKNFQYDTAKSQYESGGYSTPSSSSSSTGNFQDIVKQSLEMQKQANAPAIQSLQASIPEISQSFATQKQQVEQQIEPLKQRYQSLLADVTGRAKASEEAQTRITSGELGKRGIVGSSTLAQQEIQSAVEPIRSGARGAITEIGLGQEQGLQSLQNTLAGLTTSEVEQKRAVQNAIAQLEAGGGQTAVQNALALLQNQQQQAGASASLDLQKRQQELADKVFEQIQLPESKSLIANRAKESEPSNIMDFLSMFGVAQTPKTGFANVDSLLAQGRFDEARQLLANP